LATQVPAARFSRRYGLLQTKLARRLCLSSAIVVSVTLSDSWRRMSPRRDREIRYIHQDALVYLEIRALRLTQLPFNALCLGEKKKTPTYKLRIGPSDG
jgi:hypothetical protein